MDCLATTFNVIVMTTKDAVSLRAQYDKHQKVNETEKNYLKTNVTEVKLNRYFEDILIYMHVKNQTQIL